MKNHVKHILAHVEQVNEYTATITVNEWLDNLKEIEKTGTGIFLDIEAKHLYPNILEAEKIYNSKLYKALK